jgi:hypothetical protein
MLKNREPNPLAVFNMRRLDYCPPHFQTLTFNLATNERDILNWIYENTEGRFYLGRYEPTGQSCAAFEIHNECTYFGLFLGQINKIPEYQ